MSQGRRGRLSGASAVALLGLSLACAAAIVPAEADKVGVAAAVNPDAFSSLAGSPQSQLSIGKSIFYNERINTTGSGLVQVLLVDGSTFTVGPGSDLVIDKFVYDPKKGTGQIAASFSKGVMRFVGGKLSKNDGGVTVDTPAGALAIRGGIGFMDFKSATNYSVLFVFGEYIKMGGKTLYMPGYGWFMNNGQFNSRPFDSNDLKTILAALTNGNPNPTPPDTPKPNSLAKLFNTQSLNQLISDATATQIQGEVDKQLKTDSPTPDTPTPVDVRVLASPGVYVAYGFTIDNRGDHGILGGGSYEGGITPALPADDFVWEFGILGGRLLGTIVGLTDASCNGGDCGNVVNNAVSPNPVVNFPWFEPVDCPTGRCEVTPASNATVTQGSQQNYTGYAVRKDGFFAYQLVGQPSEEDGPERIMLFGGEQYSFTTTEQDTLYKFNLTEDLLETSAFGPFASSQSSPIVTTEQGTGPGTGYVSPLLLLDNGAGETGPGGVWLQTNFFLGSGDNKGESFINVALGEWSETDGLTGARRGGSHVGTSYSFSGDIASVAGPDGTSHFLGTGADNPNFVVGADSIGSHDIFRDTPLITDPENDIGNQIGATYHVATLAESGDAPTQLGGSFNGYAAGMVEHANGARPDAVVTKSPNDVFVNLDATTSKLTAGIKVTDLGLLTSKTYKLSFGGEGLSSYIDDTTFAGLETPNTDENPRANSVAERRLLRTTTVPAEANSYLVSSGAIDAENTLLFPVLDDEGQVEGMAARPLCMDCDFLKWGAWGTQVAYGNQTDAVHLGWWIGGEIVSNSDMPITAKATYEGSAIGNVANNLTGDGWTNYVATGDLGMSWDFGRRSGTLAISNFDTSVNNGQGFSWSGPIARVPGSGSSLNQFAGVLGGNGMIGATTGSFVRGPDNFDNGIAIPKSIPQGVVGNWNVGNSAYNAAGIFGGSIKP